MKAHDRPNIVLSYMMIMFCFFVLLYIIMVYYIRKSIYHAILSMDATVFSIQIVSLLSKEMASRFIHIHNIYYAWYIIIKEIYCLLDYMECKTGHKSTLQWILNINYIIYGMNIINIFNDVKHIIHITKGVFPYKY